MKTWDTDDAWESDDGRFVALEDHEQVVEQLMAVIRMTGVGILDSRRQTLDEARAAVAALPCDRPNGVWLHRDDALAAIDALRGER